jgi:hypothetical protein
LENTVQSLVRCLGKTAKLVLFKLFFVDFLITPVVVASVWAMFLKKSTKNNLRSANYFLLIFFILIVIPKKRIV